MTNPIDSCWPDDEDRLDENCNRENKPICPECGCCEMSLRHADTTKHPQNSPWSFVDTVLVCNRCQSEIPQHVAERWCGASEKEARKLWREEFRDPRSNDKN